MNISVGSIQCQELHILPPSELPKVPVSELSDAVGRIFRASGNLFIVKDVVKGIPKQFAGCVRSAITGFSPGAGVRMRRYLRECLPEYLCMVTLTYPGFFETNGKAVKEHLRRFLQEVRREYIRTYGDDGTHSSFWFLEFQARGAPHFHIFTTWSPSKEWVARRWYEIVNSEDDRHLRAGTRVEFLRSGRAGTISYASKYAAKQEQKAVPEEYENVGRFWGVFGRRTTMSADTFVKANESAYPDIKSDTESIFNVIKRAIFEGLAEVIVRNEGVLVVSMNDWALQRKIRTKICRLAIRARRFDSIFFDAEIELGDGYQL